MILVKVWELLGKCLCLFFVKRKFGLKYIDLCFLIVLGRGRDNSFSDFFVKMFFFLDECCCKIFKVRWKIFFLVYNEIFIF